MPGRDWLRRGDFSLDARLLRTAAMAAVIGGIAIIAARVRLDLIRFLTNRFFFQTVSLANRSPAEHPPGAWVVAERATLAVHVGRTPIATVGDAWGDAPLRFALAGETCRLVATRLARHRLERLPVVKDAQSLASVGIVSRSVSSSPARAFRRGRTARADPRAALARLSRPSAGRRACQSHRCSERHRDAYADAIAF